MLRAEFWRLVRNESTLVGIEATANPEASRLPHLAHCFDYLRQTTMCNMDTTIEWPTGNLDEKGMKRINGYNITHICKKKVSWPAHPVEESDLLMVTLLTIR